MSEVNNTTDSEVVEVIEVTPEELYRDTTVDLIENNKTFKDAYMDIISGKSSLNMRETTRNLYIAQVVTAQSELKKLIRMMTLLDRVQDKFENLVNEHLNRYSLETLTEIMNTIMTINDRSLKIITKVSDNQSLSVLVEAAEEYKKSFSASALKAIEDPISRENIRKAASELLNDLTIAIEDEIFDAK